VLKKEERLERIDYKKYPILFVDDEEENLEIFSIHFKDTFTIYTAPDGPSGLELLDRKFAALVLSDQRMAGMTGMEFLQEVRKRHPEMVLMLETAYSDLDVLADGVSAGLLYSYILKPWEVKDLKIALNRGIEHYYLVSERDRLHREQIETMKKMARANRLSAVGTLAAGIAHEIRNPLVSIQTFLEMVPTKLAELSLSDTSRIDKEFWEKFRTLSFSEIQRIRTLISELVNFARPSPPNLSEENISHVIRTMIELTRKEAEKRKIKVEYREDEDLPGIRIDISKIKQVLLNLLLNALQASHEGGKIEVVSRSVRKQDRGRVLQVVVRDEGEGIPEKIQEQLFDPFFTTKDPGEGIGLGLTICHQVMEEHSGEIKIKSQPGQGTEITLSFTMEQESE
jgi:two-component system NtrC family sensor kinase